MSDNDTALLTLDSVGLSIAGTEILHDISWQVRKGKTLGIIGESGSGKSMTALSIMQLLPRGCAMSGTVHFDGKPMHSMQESQLCQLRGNDIGMVFQEPMTALNPLKSIGDQVSETVRLHQRLSRSDAEGVAQQALERVGLPNEQFPLSRYPHELSGGQRQRVVIAIAVACQPKLLIADEPTTALDVTTQAGILELLKQLQKEQDLALVLITHDLAVVSDMADDIVVMREGRIVEQGNGKQVFRSPQNSYTQMLLQASTLTHVKRTPQQHHTTEASKPLLSVQDLVCEYSMARTSVFGARRRFRAVDKVSFDIHAGESLGLVGESGCGKSTLTRALLGLMPLHSGTIHLGGESVSSMQQVSRAARQRMQVVFQDPYGSFNPRHKVGRLISEPLHVLDARLSALDKRQRIDDSLERVGMSINDKDKYIHEFSGGQRQRIAIARALVIDPQIVILDEAVSALDVSVRAQVLNLLNELAEQQGIAYLFISHDLSVVQQVTDRVMVMRRGKIVERGDTAVVFRTPQHAYTQELIAAVPVIALS